MEKILTKEISCLDNTIREYISKDHDFRKMFNMTQFHIVMYLIKHMDENVCQKDLEIETNLKKASITGAIDSLVDKGFVERIQADDDKRKNYVKLTTEALIIKNNIELNVKELNQIMTNNITQEELNNFFNVIDRIKKNILEKK